MEGKGREQERRQQKQMKKRSVEWGKVDEKERDGSILGKKQEGDEEKGRQRVKRRKIEEGY